MAEITFDERLKSLFSTFGDKQTMVLATSSEGRVTARSMSVIVLDSAFCFQTDARMLKAKQIKENPMVALSFSNVSIEGRAEIIGAPYAPECKRISEKYRAAYKGSYDAYSGMPDELLYRVTPLLITLWQYENGKPYREKYDLRNNDYEKRWYE
ncbi:MAG: pyridoxamine 5'-phosphate oxidase family protein [Eubacteriales bacterium]|nr:pyridoxamine 5'-phosphate oxidase family protein [Eubacteriales bacterium]MDD3880944.1 pyridoxamine 5'-phosphate oxidase family protein [Eubacteriales bacterium]MDD4511986.1 pyridoxamine 5'-phosphate oxidase family protein [Eubacteriales bacterium]